MKVRVATLVVLLFIMGLSTALLMGSGDKYQVTRGGDSTFVFGSSGRTIKINYTVEQKFKFSKEMPEELIKRGYDAKDHIVTIFLDSSTAYSIFHKGKGLVGVIWGKKSVVEGRIDLVLVKNETGVEKEIREGNSTYVRGYSSQTYKLVSDIMPAALSGQLLVHYGDSWIQWYYLNTKMAELHAAATFYIIYGQAIVNIIDNSWDWYSSYVTRCYLTHGVTGIGSIAGSVRADGKYMFCLGALSRQCTMGAWYTVDVWLNTNPGRYGSDGGTFGCNC